MSPPFAEPDSQRRRMRVRAVTEKAAGTTSASGVMILTEQFPLLPLPKVERPGVDALVPRARSLATATVHCRDGIVRARRRTGSVSRTREGLPAASCRIEALLRQDGKGPEKTLGHMGRLRVGELVGRVLGAVVMGIAVKGRVRDHQGAVTVAPE